jgi:predicted ATPase/DNA-binding winged helix-turn-helix (wHTH) protein
VAERPSFPAERAVSFGSFRLLPAQQLLLEGETPVRLGSRALDILTALVERPGELVSKAELTSRVWPDTLVDENTLRVHVAGLRRALGDGQPGRRYLANVPGRGYRFVAPVDRSGPERSPIRPAEVLPTHNLPISKSRVVGRGHAIDALRNQLLRQRLVTVVGSGGIGKTTVALAVAEALFPAYPDGIRFIDLAPIEDPQFVLSALGTALGHAVAPEDAVPRLVEFLRDKRMLIVLDSCERTIAAAASLVEQLLAGTSGVDILATSREPLRVDGERIHRLLPLDVPSDPMERTAAEALEYSGVQLFVERAAAILDGFELTDTDAPIVSDICRKLGGIALAIELAAARTDAFGIQQLAVLLDDRFRILKQGKRTAQPRHRSLAAMLDWSYEFLPEGERLVLCRLSVFAGIFTLASAVAVAGDDDIDVIDALANLVAKSLVFADVGGTTVQYHLLDTTRAYAGQKLASSGDLEKYSRRHAQHHLEWFKQAEADWARKTNAELLADYGRRLDDVRVALNWALSPTGDASVGIGLTIESIPLWLELSLLHECCERFERALTSLAAQPSPNEEDELRILVWLGLISPTAARRLPEIRDFWARAVSLAEKFGDMGAQVRALCNWSGYFWLAGDLRAMLPVAEKSSAVAARTGNAILLTAADVLLADALHYLGRHSEALSRIEPLLREKAIFSQRALFAYQVSARCAFSDILWVLGFPDRAVANSKTAFDDSVAADNAYMLSFTLTKSACQIALNVGDYPEAARRVEVLLDCSAKSASGNRNALGRCLKGALLLAQGDMAGLALLRSGLGWLGEGEYGFGYTMSLSALAQGLGAAGQVADAHQTIGEALARSNRNEERWCLPELLRVKGELLRLGQDGSQSESAENCFREALAEARRQGALSWELRAATSMARLLHRNGQTTQADELLSAIYDRFTEGFDTIDLRTAAALLNEFRARPG